MPTIHIESVTINASTPVDAGVRQFLEQLLAQQHAPAEAISQPAVSATPAIGQPWPGQGGVYAGLMRGQNGAPDYHLIVSDSEGYHASLAWGPRGVSVPGADSDFDGLANTLALTGAEQVHPAADFASSLALDGHNDWYLPARRELRLLWCTVPELFEPGWYWSSTQYSAYDAWGQHFCDGYQTGYGKAYEGRVRAVRRFLSA